MIIFLLPFFLLTFRNWFNLRLITGGDYGFFYSEQIRQYLNFPFAWETFRGAGLGGTSFLSQGVYFYNLPLGFLGQYFSFPVLERIVWLFPLLAIGVLSPYFLSQELDLFPRKFYFLAVLIFFLNTYFFMIMGGGQLTVVLGYLMIPLVFTFFLKAIKKTSLTNIVIFSFLLAILIAWDFRIAYLYFFISFLYLFFLPLKKEIFRKIFFIGLLSGLIILGLHAFWLLPFLLSFSNPVSSLSSAYTSSAAVNFLSFAKFPQALSLLHPNWPENIFGKTYFMRPEFLILPILAFLSLLFIDYKETKKQRNKKTILFFALIGLFGAFLAKGSNEPFGEVYLWIFNHIPGMVMFRDPTKFYTLTALSYSVLVPYSVWQIYEWLNSKFKSQNAKDAKRYFYFAELQLKIKNYLPNLFLMVITFYLLILIKPAWIGELSGTFKTKQVPEEYLNLKNFIVKQPEFFRTFWLPVKQRFAFYTDSHPAIDGGDFLQVTSASAVVKKLKSPEAEKLLALAGVKYVIMPYDSEGEIFLKDRKYDDSQRQQLKKELDKITWFKRIKFSNVDRVRTIVYQVSNFNDRFCLENPTVLCGTAEWKMVNPTKYLVSIKNLKEPVTLIFSENFDPGWVIKFNGKEIKSERVYERLNSFKIGKNFQGSFYVEFRPQKYMILGLIISGLTLLLILVIPIFVLLFKKQKDRMTR